MIKKRLSDITNMNSQQKSPFKDQENVFPAFDNSSTKNYVQRLLKENAVMVKLIEEKDKIIESNGLELQNLRANLQKTQLQNWHLAQSNTQMLAELNMSKDMLKTLQHELVCKDTLHKVKMLDLQEKEKMQREENHKLEGEIKPERVAVDQLNLASDKNENKVCKTKRARPTRSQSLGPPRSQQVVDKETPENKRRCLRRQSVILKPEEAHSDVSEIDVNSPSIQTLKQPFSSSVVENKDEKEPLSQSSKHKLPQRSSIGRPVRKATEKIKSYKDPPLGTKLRRP